ncbi:MAG: DUF294 nucleotidyltransferase-like domain-containing protein [Rhodobacteraceae bacterium]|nr:DUF294 nucleotidyltransferase-like domain-containing protein [Paracoccaceae bacterium]
MAAAPHYHSHASTPLGSLEFVAVDTETTGLDLRASRIIEIAAVLIRPGIPEPIDCFDHLVNPGVAIPPASTEIHGITDADVAEAAPVGSVLEAFFEWLGPRPLIGYSIGFDMSIIQAELDRCGKRWSPPRVLDVQELVQALQPNLRDNALETVAEWLGINTDSRHRALPDAIMTARVFRALIPRLRSIGVQTFAEATRISADIRQKTGGLPHPAQAKTKDYINIDSYHFRNRVSDVMATPPLIVERSASLSDVIALMVKHGVGSVFIEPDGQGGHGYLTERDLLRTLYTEGKEGLARTCHEITIRPLETVSRKEFLYRAIITLSSKNIRHLGVLDENSDLVGALSARDLFSNHSNDVIALGRHIEIAGDAAELGLVWSGLTSVARSLALEGVTACSITAIISRELRALTQRACELAEAELLAENPSLRLPHYAMLILGSGGRGESLLAMDQDNAIIHETDGDPEETDSHLQKLGQRVADMLNSVGVKYCPGGIMASNRDWRRSTAEWERTVSGWLERTRPEDIMNADIFFDSMPVHGDRDLADRLRVRAIQRASQSKPFLSLMASNVCNFQGALGWLGRWKLENGRIDLKKSGIMPIFSAARAVSLEHVIYARSTADRLRDIKKLDLAPPGLIDDLLTAHGFLLNLILEQQLRDIDNGRPPSNTITPRELDGADRTQLKWALEQVGRVPDLVGKPTAI